MSRLVAKTVEIRTRKEYSEPSDMPEPEYLICLVCDTPTYVFEWGDDRVKSAVCSTCGNDERSEFLTPQEYEQED